VESFPQIFLNYVFSKTSHARSGGTFCPGGRPGEALEGCVGKESAQCALTTELQQRFWDLAIKVGCENTRVVKSLWHPCGQNFWCSTSIL